LNLLKVKERLIRKPPFYGKTSKEVLDKNKIGDIIFKNKQWNDISRSGIFVILKKPYFFFHFTFF